MVLPYRGFALLVALFVGSTALGAQVRPPRRPIGTPAKTPAAAKVDSARLDSLRADSLAKAAAAQPKLPTVFGLVFDSVHNAPLTGATVLIEGQARIALTNNLGQFRIDSVPVGEHRIRVDHPLLDSIGIQLLTDPFKVVMGDVRAVELFLPSAGTLLNLSCPPARRALGPSAVIGRLLDADTEEPVAGARVSVAWEETSLSANLRKVPRLREAVTGADGVYRICGLPPKIEGTLQAMHKGVSTSEVKLALAEPGLMIQGLKIGNSTTVAVQTGDSAKQRQQELSTVKSFSNATLQRGTASLSGRVINVNGLPVERARVDVAGTSGVARTNERGEFRIDSLPSGTQTVIARQIGFSPVERTVELSSRTPATIVITMDRAASVQTLNRVVVEANIEERGLANIGFAERKRAGLGWFVSGEQIAQRAQTVLSDLFRTAPGLRVIPAGRDYIIESTRTGAGMGGCVRYFLDGTQFEAIYPGDVDRMIPPWEVGAVEVYNGSNVPVQFTSAGRSSCTSVVIWSKNRIGNAGRQKR